VADEGNAQNRARSRTGIRTWPVERARRAWDSSWPGFEFAVPARIREWAALEVGAGRLLPWFAVAFGAGIVLYFTAEHEPAWWAASALAVVVRGTDGRLAFHHTSGDTFAMREWLAADADGRDVKDRGLGEGIACDPSGCLGQLGDGRLVSYVLAPDAFEEDCRRATVIVATRDEPPDCDATVIGRNIWRERGALALRRDGSGFVMESAWPPNFDRPWTPRRVQTAGFANSDTAAGLPAALRSPPRDATPRPEDLQADD
jgi:hypothetical protein